jgi:hypothetical protein
MFKERKKAIAHTSDGNVTRLARKYNKLNTRLKHTKDDRIVALDELRDLSLGYFKSEDEIMTRVLKTNSVSITVNKRTIRKVSKTDMEAVFETISEKWNIKRSELDNVIEHHTTHLEIEVKPSLKVEELK